MPSVSAVCGIYDRCSGGAGAVRGAAAPSAGPVCGRSGPLSPRNSGRRYRVLSELMPGSAPSENFFRVRAWWGKTDGWEERGVARSCAPVVVCVCVRCVRAVCRDAVLPPRRETLFSVCRLPPVAPRTDLWRPAAAPTRSAPWSASLTRGTRSLSDRE